MLFLAGVTRELIQHRSMLTISLQWVYNISRPRCSIDKSPDRKMGSDLRRIL